MIPALYFMTMECRNYWFMNLVIYGMFPLMDTLFPMDTLNPSPKEQQHLESQAHFKLPLYLSLFMDWAIVYRVFVWEGLSSLSYFQLVGLALYLGSLATSNINISHELCHKNNAIDSFLGTATTSKNLYMHFPIHHL